MSIKHKRRTVIVNCGEEKREGGRERETRKGKRESDASNERRGEEERRDPGKNERAVFHTHDSLG